MKQFPFVTIAILNYNGKTYLQQNLPFLHRLTYPNVQIVVIDNASTDGSVEWLNQYHPQVLLVCNKENFGFAKGYNEGLKNILSDYYLLLNTDVEVTPNFLEPLVTLLEKEATAVVCQPKILSLQDRKFFEYAGAAGGLLDKFGYPFARGRLFFTCEQDNQQYDNEMEVFWASGACFLVKADAFWSVGGFYEFFFMQSEETDLCWRLKRKGLKIYYTHKSHVYHHGGAHLAYASSQKTFLNFRNNWIMLYRNMPAGYFWWTTVPTRLVLDMAASFYFLRRSDFKNFLSVYAAIYQFGRWYWKTGRREKEKVQSFTQLTGVYMKSIAMAYFLKQKKRYIDL